MNREKLEEWLKDISTPTGLSYSGDQTLSNSEVDTILEYVDNLQSKIDKAIEFVESMEYCGQEDYFYDNKAKDPCGNDNTFNDSKFKLLDILKENK